MAVRGSRQSVARKSARFMRMLLSNCVPSNLGQHQKQIVAAAFCSVKGKLRIAVQACRIGKALFRLPQLQS